MAASAEFTELPSIWSRLFPSLSVGTVVSLSHEMQVPPPLADGVPCSFKFLILLQNKPSCSLYTMEVEAESASRLSSCEAADSLSPDEAFLAQLGYKQEVSTLNTMLKVKADIDFFFQFLISSSNANLPKLNSSDCVSALLVLYQRSRKTFTYPYIFVNRTYDI